jgi:integral membrane protein
MVPKSTIGKLRVWALLEGLSLILLIMVAVPLKYGMNIPEPTRYIGAAHGGLFIFYSIWLAVAAFEYRWPLKWLILCFIAAFVPFGTLWADKAYFKAEARRLQA